MNQEYQGKELQFEVRGKQFAARRWGDAGGRKILALHGWLDNANSFELLAPELIGVDLIALDLSGHGQSSHRSIDATYNIWDDIPEVMAIVDQLEWEKFSLIGHSRGAIISMLISGAFPDRISSAVMIDGFWPGPTALDHSPKQLAQFVTDDAKQRTRLTERDNVETFIQARENGIFKLSRDAAERLTRRSLRSTANGYTWSSDARLRNSSAFKLSQGHIDAFLEAITATVLVVLGDKGIPLMAGDYVDDIKRLQKFQVEVLPGSHHLHLEQDSVEGVARAINLFHSV